MMVWPEAVRTSLRKADGSTQPIEFPAGTAFMGAVWDEEVWPLVKTGQISGYSFGGRGTRVTVIDEPDEPAKRQSLEALLSR
jgi:hypothetical protein